MNECKFNFWPFADLPAVLFILFMSNEKSNNNCASFLFLLKKSITVECGELTSFIHSYPFPLDHKVLPYTLSACQLDK